MFFRESLSAQLELTLTKADSEQLARSIAEEQYSDLEKEKTMIELEVKELIARHKSDMSDKTAQITQLEELNQQLTSSLDQKVHEKEDLNSQINQIKAGTCVLSIDHFTVSCVILKGNQAFASELDGVELAMTETCE
jgi:predicted  nucleic acid-binding Zn-ribbon protein